MSIIYWWMITTHTRVMLKTRFSFPLPRASFAYLPESFILHIPQVSKIRMILCTVCSQPFVWVIYQQFLNQIATLFAYMRLQTFYILPLLVWKIKVNMTCILFPFFQKTLRWISLYTKDFIDLVYFIFFSRKLWIQTLHFKPDASDTPHIHLAIIISICKQTFWRPIPPCAYIFSIRVLGIAAST